MSARRVLVTGGSGFIGTNLVDFLCKQGDHVLNLDHGTPRNPVHRDAWINVDLLDRERLITEIAEFRPDFVLHMGARTDLEGHLVEDYQANLAGLRNLIDAIKASASVKRAVFASTRLVCRIGYQPKDETDYCATTAYGQSKVKGEELVRGADLQLPWVIVRPTSIWGPWFDVPYKSFFTAIRRGLYLHPRGTRIRKSFGFVGNTVFQLDRLMSCDEPLINGKTIYLCDYTPIEVHHWAKLIQEAMQVRPFYEVPLPVLRACATIGDLLKRGGMSNPPLTSFRLDNLLTEMVHDTGPLAAACGALPYSLEAGVKATVGWMNEHGA